MDRDTRAEIDDLWRYFDELRQHLGYSDLESEKIRNDNDEMNLIKDHKKKMDDMYERLSAQHRQYNNVIAAIGLAGYWAGWSLVREIISDERNSIIGICWFISLALFVLSEVISMWAKSAQYKFYQTLIGRDLTPSEYREQFDIGQGNYNKRNIVADRFINFAFFSSFGTAIIGGVIIMSSLFLSLPIFSKV